MAQRKPILIDGELTHVASDASLADVVAGNVHSVFTNSGQLVPRARFNQTPVPDGFESNLSAINKGAAP